MGSVGSAGYIHVSDYDDFMTCDYVILSSLPDVTVSLEAVRMDIEPSVGCIYDYLAVSILPFMSHSLGLKQTRYSQTTVAW